MKQQKSKRKLVLVGEVVKTLQRVDLGHVVGGMPDESDGPNCNACTNRASGCGSIVK